MTERTRAEFGRIDILVNNAGIYRAAAPLDVTEAHWDAVMNVNAKAVFFACQAVLPLMIARSEEHTSELQSQSNLVCRLLLEKKKKKNNNHESTKQQRLT